MKLTRANFLASLLAPLFGRFAPIRRQMMPAQEPELPMIPWTMKTSEEALNDALQLAGVREIPEIQESLLLTDDQYAILCGREQ